MEYKNVKFRGISRVPDDSLATSGDLMAAVDVVNDGAGVVTIEEPIKVVDTDTVGRNILLIHEPDGERLYIYQNGALYFLENGKSYKFSEDLSAVTSAQVLGRTLIVNCVADGLHYFLWDSTIPRAQRVSSGGGDIDDGGSVIDPGNGGAVSGGDISGPQSSPVAAEKGFYRDLGSKPPFVEIQFGLKSQFTPYPGPNGGDYQDTMPVLKLQRDRNVWPEMNTLCPRYGGDNASGFTDFSFSLEGKDKGDGEADTAIERLTSWVMSYMNGYVAEKTSENKFVFPFFVRYAYKMFDGSLIMHSYPTLMVPNSKGPIFYMDGVNGITIGADSVQFRGRVIGFDSLLSYHIGSVPDSLADWQDLITGVDIYVTRPCFTYKQDGKVYGWKNMDDENAYRPYWTHSHIIGAVGASATTTTEGEWGLKELFAAALRDNNSFFAVYQSSGNTWSYPSYVMALPDKSESEFAEDLINQMQFFKIKHFDLDELASTGDGYKLMEMDAKTLDTLTSREQMTDDYHSRDALNVGATYVYNRRLIVGDVTRAPHAPLKMSTQWQHYDATNLSDSTKWTEGVIVRSSDGAKLRIYDPAISALWNGTWPRFMFYPDSRASTALVERIAPNEAVMRKSVPLTEHPLLEGAYWFGGLWEQQSEIMRSLPDIAAWELTNGADRQRNAVYTGNAENPFVFEAKNITDVGDGEIRAFCANTRALSHDVYGREPLFVFTTQGVWPLITGSGGEFTNVLMPVTRDVLKDGTMPLATDQVIFFLSGRGLQSLSGGSVKVVSEAITYAEQDYTLPMLTGYAMSFKEHPLDLCDTMVYDYRHSRIYVAQGYGGNQTWVLSLKTGLWTQSSTQIRKGLNSWPDCEFVGADGIYSLDNDERKQSGYFLTRPIQLSQEFLSKVRELIVRGPQSAHDSRVSVALLGTRDFHAFAGVGGSSSGRLSRLGGSPYKAHALFVTLGEGAKADRATFGYMVEGNNKLR